MDQFDNRTRRETSTGQNETDGNGGNQDEFKDMSHAWDRSQSTEKERQAFEAKVEAEAAKRELDGTEGKDDEFKSLSQVWDRNDVTVPELEKYHQDTNWTGAEEFRGLDAVGERIELEKNREQERADQIRAEQEAADRLRNK